MDPGDLLKLLDLNAKPPPHDETRSIAVAPDRADADRDQPDRARRRRVGPAARPRPGRRERPAAEGRHRRVRRRRLLRRGLRPRPAAVGAAAPTPGGTSSWRSCSTRPSTARCTPPRGSTTPPRRSPPATSPNSSPQLKRRTRRERRRQTSRPGTPSAGDGDLAARWRPCGPWARPWPKRGRRSANSGMPPRRWGWGRANRGVTTRGPSPRSSSGSAATRRSGGSATWPVGSGGWRSRSSGRRSRTASTTWSGSSSAATSAGCCRRSWSSSPCRNWNSTPCGGSSSGRRCAASTTPSSRSARGRSSWWSTSAASMEGEKAHTAKALALALAWVARRQRRWCGLVAYCGDSGERLLALPPGRWDESALCDWLSAFIGGVRTSTCRSASCPGCTGRSAPRPGRPTWSWSPTPGAASRPTSGGASSTGRRRARAGVIALVIGNPPGDLAAICDEVHTVASLDPGGDAVGRVLSL